MPFHTRRTLSVIVLLAPITVMVLAPRQAIAPRAEVFGGTIVVVGISKAEIVLAADSRISLPQSSQDTACKIIALDHFLAFSATGHVGEGDFSHPLWSAVDEARKAFRSVHTRYNADASQSELIQVAAEWGSAVSEDLKSLIQRDSTAVIGLPEDQLAIGIFIGIGKDGRPHFVTVTVTYDRVQSQKGDPVVKSLAEEYGANTDANGLYFEAYGDGAIVDEIKAAQTERAKKVSAEWQSIYKSKDPKAIELVTIKAVEATIQYSDDGKVGGKVDAVALSTAGLRWLYRKPACPED